MVKVFHASPNHEFKRPSTYLFERKQVLNNADVWSHCWITFYEYDVAVIMPVIMSDEQSVVNQNLPCIVVGATTDIVQNTDMYRILDHEVLGFPIPDSTNLSTRRDSRQISLRESNE